MVLLIVEESYVESIVAIREGQPLGVFVRDSSMGLIFSWQHGLEEPVCILL